MLPEFITKIVDKVASEHNFTNYKIETKAGSKPGDNFLGVIVAATIVGKRVIDGTEVDAQLPLIVKSPPPSKSQREMFNSDGLFERELYIYSHLLPAYTAFQKDKGLSDDELFTSFPKVYASEYIAEHDTHMLIMENLRERNFDLHPKRLQLPIDHEVLVLKALGQLHGVAFAMKDQRPKVFDEFKKLDDIMAAIMIDPILMEAVSRSSKCVKNPAYAELISLERFKRGLQTFLPWEARDKFGVITHGDCWSNNYMFQYGADKSVSFYWKIALIH